MVTIVSTFSATQSSFFCSSVMTQHSRRSHLSARKVCDPRRTTCSLETPRSRRSSILHGGASLVALYTGCSSLMPWPAKAEAENPKLEEDVNGDSGAGLVDAVKSLFDPNVETKSGKILPKAYLKAAKEVVKTLRESLEEDGKDVAKFRRSADAAKESIREYLSSWRGQQAVAAEESHVAIEKAIRSLANFYAKAGPFASMPEDIKASILEDLNTAEASL